LKQRRGSPGSPPDGSFVLTTIHQYGSFSLFQ
jgi:hypothetical protein